MSELGNTIKRHRERLKMSLSMAAEEACLSKAQVWDLEKGRTSNPTVGTLYRLGLAIGCKPLDLAKAALADRHRSYEEGNGA